MWKKKLGLLKTAISALVIFVTILIPLYGFLTNILNEFSRGLLLGVALVGGVMIVLQFALDLWIVDIGTAIGIAREHLIKTNSAAAISQAIKAEDAELMDGRWKVTGTIHLGKALWTFEVWVDSRTGTIKKSKIESHEHDVEFA